MAAPVFFYTTSGRNLYFLIVRPADNYLWNTSTTDFAAYPTGDMDNYDIQYSEVGTGTGIYSASWPTDANMITGNYVVIVCEEATPGSRDDGDLKIGGDSVYYNATSQTLEGIQGEWLNGNRLDAIIDSAALKTGYKLASDGLDSVATTEPAGVAIDFREMMVQVWRRFLRKPCWTLVAIHSSVTWTTTA